MMTHTQQRRIKVKRIKRLRRELSRIFYAYEPEVIEGVQIFPTPEYLEAWVSWTKAKQDLVIFDAMHYVTKLLVDHNIRSVFIEPLGGGRSVLEELSKQK